MYLLAIPRPYQSKKPAAGQEQGNPDVAAQPVYTRTGMKVSSWNDFLRIDLVFYE